MGGRYSFFFPHRLCHCPPLLEGRKDVYLRKTKICFESLIVIIYITFSQAEAVRMVRSAPNILRQDDVSEKVKGLHLLLNGDEGVDQLSAEHKCLHGKPLFAKLHSLEKLPPPKLPCPTQKFSKILNREVV